MSNQKQSQEISFDLERIPYNSKQVTGFGDDYSHVKEVLDYLETCPGIEGLRNCAIQILNSVKSILSQEELPDVDSGAVTSMKKMKVEIGVRGDVVEFISVAEKAPSGSLDQYEREIKETSKQILNSVTGDDLDPDYEEFVVTGLYVSLRIADAFSDGRSKSIREMVDFVSSVLFGTSGGDERSRVKFAEAEGDLLEYTNSVFSDVLKTETGNISHHAFNTKIAKSGSLSGSFNLCPLLSKRFHEFTIEDMKDWIESTKGSYPETVPSQSIMWKKSTGKSNEIVYTQVDITEQKLREAHVVKFTRAYSPSYDILIGNPVLRNTSMREAKETFKSVDLEAKIYQSSEVVCIYKDLSILTEIPVSKCVIPLDQGIDYAREKLDWGKAGINRIEVGVNSKFISKVVLSASKFGYKKIAIGKGSRRLGNRIYFRCEVTKARAVEVPYEGVRYKGMPVSLGGGKRACLLDVLDSLPTEGSEKPTGITTMCVFKVKLSGNRDKEQGYCEEDFNSNVEKNREFEIKMTVSQIVYTGIHTGYTPERDTRERRLALSEEILRVPESVEKSASSILKEMERKAAEKKRDKSDQSVGFGGTGPKGSLFIPFATQNK